MALQPQGFVADNPIIHWFGCVAERGALPVSGRPGGPGGHRQGPARVHGGAAAAGGAGGQRPLLEGQGHQDLPEEEQPAQPAGGEWGGGTHSLTHSLTDL